MQNMRRKLLSQNFLNNQKLVSQLVGSSSIGKKDLVVEIGPGKGIITVELVKHAGHVIAVELDTFWYKFLKQKLQVNNFTLYHSDFLSFQLPKLPYKVFANVPFSIEGKIIHQLIEHQNPPQDCYVIIMDELANRLCVKKGENMFSIMHKPWYDFSIIHQFKPSDFSPMPSVKPVLFRFIRKKPPLLHFNERQKYQKFIRIGFGDGQPIRNNLKRVYSQQHIDAAFQHLSLAKKSKPSQIKLGDWIALYKQLSMLA